MQRYKKERGTFNSTSSERIISITMLNKYGVEVMGSQDNYNIWLKSRNISMGNIEPISLLDSSFGIQIIREELTRIEHGVLA
ncbi:MAG: DUF2384 domain-containing protein [Bacteroidetes bacterium]|nr:DUF2384 domain-containing protein [Bacteroidota bacterium]